MSTFVFLSDDLLPKHILFTNKQFDNKRTLQMQADDYQIQNILHYRRKCLKNRNGIYIDAYINDRREDATQDLESPRYERNTVDSACCSCDVDTDSDIANILHKKCPVIALAQQQLEKLLNETDQLGCDYGRYPRLVCDIFNCCKNCLLDPNKCLCIFLTLVVLAWFFGFLIGATTCGSCQRKFFSPILNCIDNMLIFDTFLSSEDSYRAIV